MEGKVKNDGPNIRKEKETVRMMMMIYCNRKHHQKELCNDCENLLQYAETRLTFCRFGEQKTACSNCKVHCYKPIYRERIKRVMRYAGPWMLLYHPIYSVKHLMNGIR